MDSLVVVGNLAVVGNLVVVDIELGNFLEGMAVAGLDKTVEDIVVVVDMVVVVGILALVVHREVVVQTLAFALVLVVDSKDFVQAVVEQSSFSMV